MSRFHLSMHNDYDSQELSVHTDFNESDIFLIVERLEVFLKGCGYNIHSLTLNLDDPEVVENHNYGEFEHEYLQDTNKSLKGNNI